MTIAKTWKPVVLGAAVLLGSMLFMAGATAASSCFSDVDDSKWYEPFVCAMADRGVLSGRGDGTFDPDGLITRAETATIASQILDRTVNHGDIELASDGYGWSPWGDIEPTGMFNAPGQTITTADGALVMELQSMPFVDGVEYGLKYVELCWKVSDGTPGVSGATIWSSTGIEILALASEDDLPVGCTTIYVGAAAPHGASIGIFLEGGEAAELILFGVRSTWTPLSTLSP